MTTFRTLALAALVGASGHRNDHQRVSAYRLQRGRRLLAHANRYVYPPTLGLTIHDNDWKWKEGEKHKWREHEGKGYWKGGTWEEF